MFVNSGRARPEDSILALSQRRPGLGPQGPLQAVSQAGPQARMRGNGRPGGQQTVRAGVNCAR